MLVQKPFLNTLGVMQMSTSSRPGDPNRPTQTRPYRFDKTVGDVVRLGGRIHTTTHCNITIGRCSRCVRSGRSNSMIMLGML